MMDASFICKMIVLSVSLFNMVELYMIVGVSRADHNGALSGFVRGVRKMGWSRYICFSRFTSRPYLAPVPYVTQQERGFAGITISSITHFLFLFRYPSLFFQQLALLLNPSRLLVCNYSYKYPNETAEQVCLSSLFLSEFVFNTLYIFL